MDKKLNHWSLYVKVGDRGRLSLDAPRSPSLALGPVLSPIRPCATVWGGRGADARTRGDRWRLWEPFHFGAYWNRHSCKDPKRNDADDYVSVLYNKDVDCCTYVPDTAASCVHNVLLYKYCSCCCCCPARPIDRKRSDGTIDRANGATERNDGGRTVPYNRTSDGRNRTNGAIERNDGGWPSDGASQRSYYYCTTIIPLILLLRSI